MKGRDEKDWADFVEFLSVKGQNPPESFTNRILSSMKAELNPSFIKVFGRLFMVHVIAGTVTLFLCPQLGVGPFQGEMGLMHIFMNFGPVGCALACGSLFIGLSVFLAAFLLKKEELHAASRHGLSNVSLLIGASYGLLMCLGGESDFSHSVFWVLGGLSSGLLILKIQAVLATRRLKSLLS